MTTTIAWTGHRPGDLMPNSKDMLFNALDMLGVDKREDLRFVVGGALGTDSYAARYAMTRGIPFSLILPFRPSIMTAKWLQYDRDLLDMQIDTAIDVQIIHDEESYDVRAYQERNIAMVNRAEVVFAVWTGKPFGGTFNCIQYAKEVNKQIWNLWPLDGKLHAVR